MAIQYNIAFPTYLPAMRTIASITNAVQAVVTTDIPHKYLTGMSVRFNIPLGFGMQQLNQVIQYIIVTGENTFQVDINTLNFDPYVIPAFNPGHHYTPGFITPIGEKNDMLNGATQNVLPRGTYLQV
jgi:hypothetical protein